jgi:hypothetical protein
MKILQLLFGLGLSLSFLPPALAQLTYQPPPERRQQQKTQSATTRGCSQPLPRLLLLAPPDHVAATAAAQPTFLFYLSGPSPQPLKISLTRPYVAAALWQDERELNSGGVLAVTLPPSVQLETEADYILTAELPCHRERPDESSYVRVVFKRVAAPAQTPAPTSEPTERVAALAGRGLWYDALALSYQESRPDFQHLLTSIGLELK